MEIDDPLQWSIDLPYSATYYPLGFRLNLTSNSREVHRAAAESWGMYDPEFDREPVELRIIVQPEGPLAPEPSFRLQGHLVAMVSDRHNFACLDLNALFGHAFISQATADDHAWFRWFFLESLVYMALVQRYMVPMHAACVARNGAGVLLFGGSSAGKSTLAFACARAGWTYITDDATTLIQGSEDRSVIGKPHQVRFRDDAPLLFPELQGYLTRARPNGKLSIEVPLSAFPHIQTAPRCQAGFLVWLDRRSGVAAHVEVMAAEQVIAESLRGGCSYGGEVQERHEKAMRRLMDLPAYRLVYERLDDAIGLLSQLT